MFEGANMGSMITVLIILVGILSCAQNARSRQLLNDEQHIRLRIIHRSSQESPHWNPDYRNQVHLIRDLIAVDQERLKSFGRILQEKSGDDKTPPKSTAVIRDDHEGDHPALVSRLASGSSFGSGQYFAELQIGTPPRKFPLIVDTGSDLTWIYCSPPNNSSSSSSSSPPPVPWYDKSSSSSYREIPCTAGECLSVPAPVNSSCSARAPNPCDYTYSYSDQSGTTGILVYETVSMNSTGECGPGDNTTTIAIDNVALGCASKVVGTSFLGASGVLGLGQGPIALPTQTRDTVLGGIFSYCLVDYLRGSNASSLLVLGRTPGPKMELQYTPLVRNHAAQSFYYVGVLDVLVDGKVVEGIQRDSWEIDKDGNRGTIIDSGSTLSYFREPIYSKVLGALNESINLPMAKGPAIFELCYNVSTVPGRMPKLALRFEGGSSMEVPWNNYMVLVSKNVECVAIQDVRTSYGFNILGNLLQQEFHIEYDKKEARIGFKKHSCSAV